MSINKLKWAVRILSLLLVFIAVLWGFNIGLSNPFNPWKAIAFAVAGIWLFMFAVDNLFIRFLEKPINFTREAKESKYLKEYDDFDLQTKPVLPEVSKVTKSRKRKNYTKKNVIRKNKN